MGEGPLKLVLFRPENRALKDPEFVFQGRRLSLWGLFLGDGPSNGPCSPPFSPILHRKLILGGHLEGQGQQRGVLSL